MLKYFIILLLSISTNSLSLLQTDCTYAGDILSIDGNNGFSCEMTDSEIDEKLNTKCNELYPGSRSITYSDLVFGGYNNIINLPLRPSWPFQPAGQQLGHRGCDLERSRLCATGEDTWSEFPEGWASHGGAILTAMCVYGECQNSTPDNTCTNGILATGSNSDVCCSNICGTCGGDGCAQRLGGEDFCCISGVRSKEKYCDEAFPPCLIRTEEPREIVNLEDYFSDTWNGTCNNSDIKGTRCCDDACGQCGGTGCGSVNNLNDDSDVFAHQRCCLAGIERLDRVCGPGVGPPCVVKKTLEDILSTQWDGSCNNPDSKNKRCCDDACDICGGAGCGTEYNINDGSSVFLPSHVTHQRCCVSGIESLGRVCGPGVGPPCVIPQTSRKMLQT